MITRFTGLGALGALAALSGLSPAVATTFAEEAFTCPVGGDEFTALVPMSSSSWGQRPDGRAYGTLPVWPLPECPENGFVLFDEDFTPEEIALLEAAVASDEYKAMREAETPHYRAWWLKARFGRELASQAGSLLVASWESDDDPARKTRYQGEFAALAARVDRGPETAEDWFWLNLRAANALRELGRFDEALERLALVMESERLPADPEERAALREFAAGLEALMREANIAAEPANLVPREFAVFRCVVAEPPLTASEEEVCAGEPLRDEIAAATYEDEAGERHTGEAAVRAMARDWR